MNNEENEIDLRGVSPEKMIEMAKNGELDGKKVIVPAWVKMQIEGKTLGQCALEYMKGQPYFDILEEQPSDSNNEEGKK